MNQLIDIVEGTKHSIVNLEVLHHLSTPDQSFSNIQLMQMSEFVYRKLPNDEEIHILKSRDISILRCNITDIPHTVAAIDGMLLCSLEFHEFLEENIRSPDIATMIKMWGM